MIDLKITSGGDFIVDENGDIALTALTNNNRYESNEDQAMLAAQMAYMAIKTDLNDFLLHPYLGNELYKILGLPNKEDTAKLGEKLISQALKKWGVPGVITIESYPIEIQKIRFEVKITIGNPPKVITLTIDKILDDMGLLGLEV